jgi:hypothetical protein
MLTAPQNVNLWIDSTDFPIERRREAGHSVRGKRSEHWSFKLKKPGRRFQYVVDGRAKVVWRSSGYSPKIHDGQYVEVRRGEFERLFHGGHFVGDEHYAKLKRLLKNPHFEAPHRDKGHLTAAEEKYNVDVAHLRARVEMPFAWLKTTFKALEVPWAGELEQLDNLVAYASAVYNMV